MSPATGSIAAMNGTPHLLTDVKFDERRKGYDPEQVDNFLERVSGAVAQLQDKLREATSRAEEADTRIAEAKRAQAVAEAQVDKLKADLERTQAMPAVSIESHEDPGAVAEEATNVLVMAQKAADATRAEANQQAMTTVSDARTKAAEIVAEAERQAEETLEEARRRSGELLDAQSAVVLEEARNLEDTRDQLAQDVSTLEAHFGAQRDQLRRQVERLLEVLDAGERQTLPQMSGASVAGFASSSDSRREGSDDGATVEDTNVSGKASIDDKGDASEESGDSHTAADSPSGSDDVTDGVTDDASGEASTDASDDASGDVSSDDSDGDSDGDTGEAVAAADGPSVSIDPEVEPKRMTETRDADLATDRLFGTPAASDDADEPVGGTGALFSSLNSDDEAKTTEPVLGKPDARADEAMRAFFEADFDKEPETRSRFGRRR